VQAAATRPQLEATSTATDSCAQVKFSERTLKFKVAAGGKEERDLWVAALQAAKKQQEATDHARRSGVGKLEQLQKV